MGTQNTGKGDVRFFYSSLLAVPEEEEALKEEVKEEVGTRVLGRGRGGGGEEEKEGGEEGMSTTVNFAPPKSLRKTVLKLTEKITTVEEEGDGREGGREGVESFEVLVNVVMCGSWSRSSLPSSSPFPRPPSSSSPSS